MKIFTLLRAARASAALAGALVLCIASSASASMPEYVTGGATNTLKLSFTTASSNTAFGAAGAGYMVCSGSSGKGDILGAKGIVKLKLTDTGCTAPPLGNVPCQSSPKKLGVVTTQPLKGELVYAKESPTGANHVADLLSAEKAGKPYAKFKCGPVGQYDVEATGAILTAAGPVNGPESLSGTLEDTEAVTEQPGCGLQGLQYVLGSSQCEHLNVTSTIPFVFGPAYVVSTETVTFKTASHPVGIRG